MLGLLRPESQEGRDNPTHPSLLLPYMEHEYKSVPTENSGSQKSINHSS